GLLRGGDLEDPFVAGGRLHGDFGVQRSLSVQARVVEGLHVDGDGHACGEERVDVAVLGDGGSAAVGGVDRFATGFAEDAVDLHFVDVIAAADHAHSHQAEADPDECGGFHHGPPSTLPLKGESEIDALWGAEPG